MVVIEQKRFKGQDGKPTHPKLVKALRETKDLEQIPHRFYFPKVVLKNFITIKKAVLANREAYIRSGGGNKMTSVVCIIEGMCQPKNSKVLMSNGELKNIQDVKIGDEVISPHEDGTHTFEKVESLHSHFEKDVYDVWEKNRTKRKLYSCSANHKIPIYRVKQKRISRTRTVGKEVFEFMEAKDIAKYKNPIISFTCNEIDFNFNNRSLNLPAYDLGVYLGDGCYTTSHLVRITTSNEEIIDSLSEKYLSFCQKIGRNSKDYSFSTKSNFAFQLRSLGLYNKRSGDKFIPKKYLMASTEDRWELLSGLIDTDGHMTENHSIEYVTKSERLAKDIRSLVFSLGGRVNFRKKVNTLPGNRIKEYFRFNIQFTEHSKLNLRCIHKAYGKKRNKPRGKANRIKIKLIRAVPQQVYGFSITGKSKLYITDNWMVTHNSGSGKSTIGSQVGIFLDPKMTLEVNYAWNMKRLMQLVEHTYPGMVIIMDEAMVVNSRSANSQDNLKLIIALSQIRSKGVFFIFCINSVHQLEKTIPLSRADFLIRVKRVGGLSGVPKYCIYDKDKMKQLIIKNAGKYSHAGVFPNVGWTTFSRYLPFDDVRYDKMKHKESKKNLEPKKKNQREKKFELGLTRLVEYCRMNEHIRSYEDFHKITDIAAISLGTLKNKFYEDLAKVNFDKLTDLIETKKRKEEEKKYCKCGEILGSKNRTGLCGECYRESVRTDGSENSIEKERVIQERAELKELRKMKAKYDRYLDQKEKRKQKRTEKDEERERKNE